MTSKNAIPTVWNGIQFRSRLEARWASFFTKMEWEWSYEPIDLDGYIPDFILHLNEDVLIEVKPFMRFEDPVIEEAVKKIKDSGWAGAYGVVGARFTGYWIGPHLNTSGYCLRSTFWHFHRNPPGIMLSSDDDLRCLACGKTAELHMEDHRFAKNREKDWIDAGNEVQWRGKQQNEEFVG